MSGGATVEFCSRCIFVAQAAVEEGEQKGERAQVACGTQESVLPLLGQGEDACVKVEQCLQEQHLCCRRVMALC